MGAAGPPSLSRRKSKGIRTVAAPLAADSIFRPSVVENGARSSARINWLRSSAAIQFLRREFDVASLSASSTAPRRAISRPRANASLQTARGASPAPITATTCRRFIFPLKLRVELFLQAERVGQFREVGDDDVRGGDSGRQLAAAGANPRGMHPGALAAEDVVERGVADEQDIGGLEAHLVEHFFEDERVGFSIAGVGRNNHRLEEPADTGVVHDEV